jgi:hypothetical protein
MEQREFWIHPPHQEWWVETDTLWIAVKYFGKKEREIRVYPKGSKEAYFTERLGEAEVNNLIRALN